MIVTVHAFGAEATGWLGSSETPPPAATRTDHKQLDTAGGIALLDSSHPLQMPLGRSPLLREQREQREQRERIRWTIIFCLVGLAVFAVPTVGLGQINPETMFQDLFSARDYPWYDEAADQAQPVTLPETRDAKSRNRHDVGMAFPSASNPTTPAAGGAASTGIAGLSVLVWIMAAMLILLVVAGLLWAFFRIESDKNSNSAGLNRRSLAQSIQHLPFQLEESGGDFRQQAERAYAAGDFRRAMTYLFSHVLVTLDQKGLIRLLKGKTNRQYLSELKPYRSLADFYQQTMVPFESTFFGDHDLSKQEFENCWTQLDGFLNRVNQASQVAS